MRFKKEVDAAERHHMMTTHPVGKLIFKMALPTISTMLVNSLYNMADTYFVSKISISASAAVGIVFPLFAIIQALSMMFALGGGSFIARKLGEGDVDTASRTLSTSFILSIICGSVIGIFSIIFLKPLMIFLGATPTSLEYASQYAFWVIVATPFFSASFVLNNCIRQEGSANLAMFGMMIGTVINLILDPILIFTFNLGIIGAAVATSISQIVSCMILFIAVLKGKSITRIKLSLFTPSKQILGEIFRIGSPAFFRLGLHSISSIMLNNAASVYGDVALGSMSIVGKLMSFIHTVLMGFGHGFQPVCGFNYGAKKYSRVIKAFVFSMKVCIGAIITLGTSGYIFAPQIVSLFRSDDPEIIRIGTAIMRANFIVLPLVAFTTMANMIFQSCGQPVQAAVLALSRNGICLIPMVLILPRILQLTGVIYAQPAADILTFLIAVPMSVHIFRLLSKTPDDTVLKTPPKTVEVKPE